MFDNYCKFDLANALYHFLQHNWEGQGDSLYKAFCLLTKDGMYKPSRHDEYFANITQEAKQVYDQLTRSNYKQALTLVING